MPLSQNAQNGLVRFLRSPLHLGFNDDQYSFNKTSADHFEMIKYFTFIFRFRQRNKTWGLLFSKQCPNSLMTFGWGLMVFITSSVRKKSCSSSLSLVSVKQSHNTITSESVFGNFYGPYSQILTQFIPRLKCGLKSCINS